MNLLITPGERTGAAAIIIFADSNTSVIYFRSYCESIFYFESSPFDFNFVSFMFCVIFSLVNYRCPGIFFPHVLRGSRFD